MTQVVIDNIKFNILKFDFSGDSDGLWEMKFWVDQNVLRDALSGHAGIYQHFSDTVRSAPISMATAASWIVGDHEFTCHDPYLFTQNALIALDQLEISETWSTTFTAPLAFTAKLLGMTQYVPLRHIDYAEYPEDR